MNNILNLNNLPVMIPRPAFTTLTEFMPSQAKDSAPYRNLQSSASTAALFSGDKRGVMATFQPRYSGFGSAAPSAAVTSGWNDVPNSKGDANNDVFDRLIDLKVSVANFAMHLQDAWRTGLFRQLDNLLDDDTWHSGDILPTLSSFRTFLRLVTLLGQPRRPSLGCTDDGDIIAAWRHDEDRLTIVCRADDDLRWVLSRNIGGERESAAGICKVIALKSRLAPYEPEVWFVADDQHPRS